MAEPRQAVVDRKPEMAAVSTLLTDAAVAPHGLVIGGEAGIGKTTLWHYARREALARGFRVLSTQGDSSEMGLAFGGLADLLAGVGPAVIDRLPPVQRRALDRVSLRGDDGPAGDERTAAAAFRSVVQHLASDVPVLIAIDDLQWLDTSSAIAVRFAARRLEGPVGLLATARTNEPPATEVESGLQMQSLDAVTRVQMTTLTLGDLHALISHRLGRVPPRPTMVRIHRISGGNPLYALELARVLTDEPGTEDQLPETLATLVQARLRGVDTPTRRVLLAAACTPEPTVDVVAAATGTSAQRVAEWLESADGAHIVSIRGNRIRFHHPLLATGVYTAAPAHQRRELHRLMADSVQAPELKARHLARSAAHGDTATLNALDAAAVITRSKGAPAAAAELLESAIALGGDTPLRRIGAAEHHFRAGALGPARRLLQPMIDDLPPGPERCLTLMLLGAVHGYSDDTAAAVQVLTQAVREAADDTELRVHCLLRLAVATVMLGAAGQAVEHCRTAVDLANRLDIPHLRSRALSAWVAVGFVHGLGVDRSALDTAVELEDPHGDATTWYQASAVQAIISAWTGDLPLAHRRMTAVHRRMLDGGTEVDVIWAANHLAAIDVWLGRYDQAAHATRMAVERAEQMGGRHVLITAWGWQATVATYLGHEGDARTAAGAAVTGAHDIGAPYLADAPSATLAFLEVSLGNYGEALNVLAPVLAAFDPAHHTEIVTGSWLPDAIEALTGLGRVDEAEHFVTALHDNGTRLDRRWMLAIAARGRALCLAARGDLPAATDAAIEAMAHHDGLPMPFEAARTQLLLGHVQRRRRQRQSAWTTFNQSLSAFNDLGTPLWADRTRAELARLGGPGRPRSDLTNTETRIAHRAAAGLSNKEIAAEQFLAVKTIEMTLSSVYRKLGIRSRAQLHARLVTQDSLENPDKPLTPER